MYTNCNCNKLFYLHKLNMSFNKNTYLSNQQSSQTNKTIFDYIIDNSMFINKAECNDYTPPFISYIPSGIKTQNVDIENELRGSIYPNTKCTQFKYKGSPINSSNNIQDLQKLPNNTYNKPECDKSFKILPNGYYNNTKITKN